MINFFDSIPANWRAHQLTWGQAIFLGIVGSAIIGGTIMAMTGDPGLNSIGCMIWGGLIGWRIK